MTRGPGCRAHRRDEAPLIYDLNYGEIDPGADLDAVLAYFDEVFADRDHRHVLTTPFSDPAVHARLALEGYQRDDTLQGLLEGALLGPPARTANIRPVVSEGDWSRLDALVRADHEETDSRNGTSHYSPEVTVQMQAARRAVADEIHFFLAWEDGEAVAFFSSWPGLGGVGMVEDLFTLPSHRNRGLARALIHHCVDDARRRGARDVLIGAVVDDTPKRLYAAMGFTPICLTTDWLTRRPGDGGAAGSESAGR